MQTILHELGEAIQTPKSRDNLFIALNQHNVLRIAFFRNKKKILN